MKEQSNNGYFSYLNGTNFMI